MGFRVSGFGFSVSGFGFWVSGVGFRRASQKQPIAGESTQSTTQVRAAEQHSSGQIHKGLGSFARFSLAAYAPLSCRHRCRTEMQLASWLAAQIRARPYPYVRAQHRADSNWCVASSQIAQPLARSLHNARASAGAVPFLAAARKAPERALPCARSPQAGRAKLERASTLKGSEMRVPRLRFLASGLGLLVSWPANRKASTRERRLRSEADRGDIESKHDDNASGRAEFELANQLRGTDLSLGIL